MANSRRPRTLLGYTEKGAKIIMPNPPILPILFPDGDPNGPSRPPAGLPRVPPGYAPPPTAANPYPLMPYLPTPAQAYPNFFGGGDSSGLILLALGGVVLFLVMGKGKR